MMEPHSDAIEPAVAQQEHFKHLRWSLQGLAAAGSAQPKLFPDQTTRPDDLALDFDHWASVIAGNHEDALSPAQRESLSAIERKLETISRDGAEFDADLWTEAAVRSSDHWADIRRLAVAALDAFAWLDADPSRQTGE